MVFKYLNGELVWTLGGSTHFCKPTDVADGYFNSRIVCFDHRETNKNNEGLVKAIIDHPLMKTVYAIRQTTQLPNYSCSENNASIQFTLSSLSHSAWNSTSSCSLQQCNTSLNGNNNCLSSSTPCYDYRTINNISYCAPGILCSILERCNNITKICSSNNSICIANSCCSPQAVCLPFLATYMCKTGTNTYYLNLMNRLKYTNRHEATSQVKFIFC
ncbi:unnamed protein product [Adineta steineri]|uniref:Uncharacterized protein n=1 Tax=Adineta steineri TaxID=433720 RepID=A0A815J1J5_9BILA|nr:unnamed protein product [Adineta steineri]